MSMDPRIKRLWISSAAVPILLWALAGGALAGGALAGERNAEADLHEQNVEALASPDTASSLPRVLIIGDSISIGYTEPVRRNLKGLAEVYRAPANCQHTGVGVKRIKDWLGSNHWDVIHFNFGIWDSHLLDPQGKLLRAEDNIPPTGPIRVRHTPEQYRENLAEIVKVLKGTGAQLIWASTTPIMRRTGERFEAIPTLNRTAEALMKSEGIAVNDLYAFVLPHVQAWQSPDKVHFKTAGNVQLGQRVAESIQAALLRKEP